MRVAVIRPGDEAIRLFDAPAVSDERWKWMRETVDGDLDYNTLPGWTGRRFGGITQMVVDDWSLVREKPRNAVASELYQADWPVEGKLRHPGISGVAVVVFESEAGETESVPDSVVNDFILRGFRVEGL